METSKTKPLVLIVEDVESNYLYLKAVLRKMEVDMAWVKNGADAIELIKSTPEIDLVLMDLQMPVMDGYEATQQIKSLRPTLPVIAQTAFVMPDDINRARESGCDDFLAKPIKSGDIIDKINKFI